MAHLFYIRDLQGGIIDDPYHVENANFGQRRKEIYLIQPRFFRQIESSLTEVFPFRLTEVDENGWGTFVQLSPHEPGTNLFYFNEEEDPADLETNEYFDFSEVTRVIYYTYFYSVTLPIENNSTSVILQPIESVLNS